MGADDAEGERSSIGSSLTEGALYRRAGREPPMRVDARGWIRSTSACIEGFQTAGLDPEDLRNRIEFLLL